MRFSRREFSPDQWVETHFGPLPRRSPRSCFTLCHWRYRRTADRDVDRRCGAVFHVYLRFINVRALGLAIRHAKGDFSDPTARGEISHFKAVATAVSGTVGVGNIGGVAVAITVAARCGFLALHRRIVVDVDQARVVHAGREIPAL